MAEDTVINTEEIRKRILYMMEKLEVNAATFADDADITRSVISNIVNQKSNVTIETLNKILSTYSSWSEAWLVFGLGSPIKSSVVSPKTEETPLTASNLFSSSVEKDKNQPISGSTITKQEIMDAVKASYLAIKGSDLGNGREIQEIKVFYSDGSFETFHKV